MFLQQICNHDVHSEKKHYLCITKYNKKTMSTQENKLISASYQLFDVTEGKEELIEQTEEGRPFVFVSGLGALLNDFERELVGLSEGASFDFRLSPSQAYGEHDEERVITVDKHIFDIDGHFDSKHIVEGAIVPLQNADGDRFNGRIVKVGDRQVTIDLNHPLAGKVLRFKGTVLSERTATSADIAEFTNSLSGGGCGDCGGDCGDCGGGCGHHDTHHHEHGEHGCCGHHGGCGHHHAE